MKCTLMNKNKEVMLTEYDSATGVFTTIYKIYNIDYAPYILKSFYKNEDINFFDNSFDYAEFMEASLSKNSKMIQNISSLKTPNNTTDGMLKKAWIIENGIRYLLKGGYRNETLQPFNEVLASEICKRLGFYHVEYSLDTYKDMVVSKCPCFITKDTELVTCHQIRNGMKNYNSIEDYEEYIKKLESEGIKDAREKMENMYILCNYIPVINKKNSSLVRPPTRELLTQKLN